MELRDLLVVDAESLSAAQAKQVTRDVIEVLSRGTPAEDQAQLRSLLITAQEIATGRKVGESQDTIRAEVLKKIQDAEARGDKRTARYLAESMAKHDMAAVDLAEQKMTDAVNKFIEDDLEAADALYKKKRLHRIDARTQELLRVNGSEYGYSPEKARKQATQEIIGPPAYEDDINYAPEKPDRQAILDEHKGTL